MIKNLTSLVSLVFFIILLVWLGSLFFVNKLYKETTEGDARLVQGYLTLAYNSTQSWDFMEELWKERPSLLKVEVKTPSQELFSSYREELKSAPFFNKEIELEINLPDQEKASQLILVYTTLPRAEVIYYTAVALAMLLGFLFIFFMFFWRFT